MGDLVQKAFSFKGYKMATRPIKRSLTLSGHRTSISLEEPFWEALKDISNGQNITLAGLVQIIDKERGQSGLSSAIRIYILRHYQQAARG